MSFKVTSLPLPSKSVNPKNIVAFVQNLRRYTKKSIIDTGTELLWNAYNDETDYPEFDEQFQILNAYGPRIIILGMATANEHRNQQLNSDDFYALCHDYLGIRESINDQTFLNQETENIILALQKVRNDRIPDNYIKFEYIRPSCSESFIARAVRIQHESNLTNINELYRAYIILSLLDDSTHGAATTICRKIFNIEPLHFFRSGFGLFALANGKSGKINFNGLTCDDEIKQKLHIDLDTCQLVASKIAYDESYLREEWYTSGMLNFHELYQKYFPDPLFKHPIIHRNSRKQHVEFLLPSPNHFFRGFANSLFSHLMQYDESASPNIGFAPKFGDAIEMHIYETLKIIFGNSKVTKIEGDKERADFHILLDECDLIIETKTRLGSYQSQSLMTPTNIADVWSRLYGACKQCASSIKKYKKPSRPIIAIILVADHITVEAAPFQKFAERAGLFRDLNIDAIEFFSWNSMEHILSETSVTQFAVTLCRRWNNKESMQLQDLMSFEIERDTPAHNYQYFRNSELLIFGKNFSK